MSPVMMPDFCAMEPLLTANTKTPARFGCSAVAATGIPLMPRSRLSGALAAFAMVTALASAAALVVAAAFGVAAAFALASVFGAAAWRALVYSSTLASKPAISAL